jgi:hypothetical protein
MATQTREEHAMRGRFTGLLVAALAVVLAACQGTVTDPPDDGNGTEVIGAGVDFGNERTRLWIDYPDHNRASSQKYWFISVDDDTTPEFEVHIGTEGARDDVFTVKRLQVTQDDVACRGFVDNDGFIDADTVSLTIDTRCLSDRGTGSLPSRLRMSALSSDIGGRINDYTGWTGVVLRS